MHFINHLFTQTVYVPRIFNHFRHNNGGLVILVENHKFFIRKYVFF